MRRPESAHFLRGPKQGRRKRRKWTRNAVGRPDSRADNTRKPQMPHAILAGMRGASTPSEAPRMWRARGRRAVAALGALTVGALVSQRAAATSAGFWERVAASPTVD